MQACSAEIYLMEVGPAEVGPAKVGDVQECIAQINCFVGVFLPPSIPCVCAALQRGDLLGIGHSIAR